MHPFISTPKRRSTFHNCFCIAVTWRNLCHSSNSICLKRSIHANVFPRKTASMQHQHINKYLSTVFNSCRIPFCLPRRNHYPPVSNCFCAIYVEAKIIVAFSGVMLYNRYITGKEGFSCCFVKKLTAAAATVNMVQKLMMIKFFALNMALCQSTVNAENFSMTPASEFPAEPKLWISESMIMKTIPCNSEASA